MVNARIHNRTLRILASGCALVVAYWGLCALGMMLFANTQQEASLWPAAGLCLYAAFVGGLSLSLFMLGASTAYALLLGIPLGSALAIGLATTVAAYISAALLRHFNFRPKLSRVRDTLVFVMAGLIPNSLLTAAIGAPLLLGTGFIASDFFWRVASEWTSGIFLGGVWVAPVLFVWSSTKTPKLSRARVVELMALTGSLGLFFYAFFSSDFLEVRKSFYLIRPHTLFPFFVWATLRFRQQGAATLGFVTGLALIVAITTGNSPYDTLPPGRTFDYLQSFISMLALTSLFLGAAVCQSDETQVSLMLKERSAWKKEREFRAMFEFSGAGNGKLDPLTGRFTRVNRKLCEILGYTDEELTHKTFDDITYPPDLAKSQRQFRALLSGDGRNGGVQIENRNVRKDGTVVWVSIIATVVKDPKGQALSVLTVTQDVTDRKTFETELKKAKEAADAANRSKSQFVANMSHEIRTPLGAILGFNEFSFDQAQTESDRRYCAEKIQQNGELLQRVIDDVLDLSKMEAGHFEVQKSWFALETMLEGVHSLLELKASEKGVRILIRSDGSVPRMVYSDPVRLRQILINVAGNALKFTDKGSVSIIVRALDPCQGREALLEFAITDTGLGMSPGQTARIFEPFQQGDATMTRRYGGSGLGLALARNFSEALGGELVLSRTKPGVGSTFICRVESGVIGTVETYQHDSQRPHAPLSRLSATGTSVRLHGRRILLADDAPDNRLLISRFLEREGAIVDQVENGEEAIAKALSASYDVLLMDIQMPVLDGIEATRQLRSQGFGPPILALTAHAMREDRLRSMDAGCNDHIAKPIDPKALVAAIERHTTALS